MNSTNSNQLPSQLLSSDGWMLSGNRIRKISEADSAAPSSLMSTVMDEGFITSCPQNVFNLLVDAVNQILSQLAFHKAMTFLAQKRLAGKSSALGYPQSASSSSVLLAPEMLTSPSSSSSTTSSSSSSFSGVVSRSTSTAKLTNTSSDNTPPLLHSSSTLSVPFVRVATFVMHPSTSTKPPSSSSEKNYTSGISLRPLPTTTQLSPYSSSTFAKNSAFNASHSIYHLHLHPPLVDFGRPFVVEQLTSFATPRQQVAVKASLERCGQSMEAHITALHQRGDVFSMARRCAFRMASATSTDGRVASAGMSAAAVASFVSELSEILEGVPVDGMNEAYGSALKACSSASPPISKAAFNSDDDENDDDTLLGDMASSDEKRLSVPASTRSSLSIFSTSPLRSSSSSASISPLSSSTNSLALSKDSSVQLSITLSTASTLPFSPFSTFSPLVLSLLCTLFTSPSVNLALSFRRLAQQAADFISQRISQLVVVGGAKERLAISSGSGSSSTSEAAVGMRGGKRDDGKSSDYGDDDEDD